MSARENILEQTGNAIAPLASDVARGVQRMLIEENYSPIIEFSLSNSRRLDVAALGPDGSFLGVEIKVSVADLRGDDKWSEYLGFCDLFYFAVPPEFPHDLVPKDHGLIVADRYGGAMIRNARRVPLRSSRRRALTLRFARASAERLARVYDPNFV